MTGTREYLVERDITDPAALDAAEFVFGPQCEPDRLEKLYAFALKSCCRDANGLRQALSRYERSTLSARKAQPLVEALVRLRTFREVPTITTAEAFCGDYLAMPSLRRAEELLGTAVPEWLFPAMVVLAHHVQDRHDFGVAARERFVVSLAFHLERWGWGDSNETSGPSLAAARALGEGYFILKRHQPDGWIVPEVPAASR